MTEATATARQRAPTPGARLVEIAPGVAFVTVLTAGVTVLAPLAGDVSALTVGVVIGAVIANVWSLAGGMPAILNPGIGWVAKRVLRFGVVLLGFRLALSDLVRLGAGGLISVTMVVASTFFATRWLARRFGVSDNLGLLVATGYSICGASAIAAMDGLIDADEEETAYAIALVTLCGSLSIALLPALGHALGLDPIEFGSWAGAAVHDVAQVIATAATYGSESVAAATVVKLTRVALLAPLVATVALRRRSSSEATTAENAPAARRPAIVPLFIVGFLAAVAIRSTGWLSAATLSDIKTVETVALTAALVGLGLGVRFANLRRLGGRPLVLGLVAWAWVAAAAFVGVSIST